MFFDLTVGVINMSLTWDHNCRTLSCERLYLKVPAKLWQQVPLIINFGPATLSLCNNELFRDVEGIKRFANCCQKFLSYFIINKTVSYPKKIKLYVEGVSRYLQTRESKLVRPFNNHFHELSKRDKVVSYFLFHNGQTEEKYDAFVSLSPAQKWKPHITFEKLERNFRQMQYRYGR